MVCYNGQLRNVSVASYFILLSSTETSSARGGYVVVPERPSRNEGPTSRKEEQTRNVPRSYLVLPQNLLNDIIWILPVFEHENLSYLVHLLYFDRNYLMNYFLNFFQLWKTFDPLFYYYYLFIVGAGVNALMSTSDRSGPYIFYGKMKMTRFVRKKMKRKVFIFRQIRHFLSVDIICKVPFPTLCLDLACKQFCFPPGQTYE